MPKQLCNVINIIIYCKMLQSFFYSPLNKLVRSTNYSRRIATNHNTFRHIFSNNAASSNNSIIVNCYTRHDFHKATNTYVIFNRNRFKVRIKFS